MKQVDLTSYNKSDYYPGHKLKIVLWYIVSILFFETSIPFPSFFKVRLLKLFGSKCGKNLVIKPSVKIKYPWFLSIGDNSWIGEKSWIDNLGTVTIGKNVVISQGGMILTGNHDFNKSDFKLLIREIEIADGVWIGARALVSARSLQSHSMICAGSVVSKNTEPYKIYMGNPAVLKGEREIK